MHSLNVFSVFLLIGAGYSRCSPCWANETALDSQSGACRSSVEWCGISQEMAAVSVEATIVVYLNNLAGTATVALTTPPLLPSKNCYSTPTVNSVLFNAQANATRASNEKHFSVAVASDWGNKNTPAIMNASHHKHSLDEYAVSPYPPPTTSAYLSNSLKVTKAKPRPHPHSFSNSTREFRFTNTTLSTNLSNANSSFRLPPSRTSLEISTAGAANVQCKVIYTVLLMLLLQIGMA